MALVRKNSLYEILFRFDGDALVGVHQVMLARVVDEETGEVISETTMPAEAITAKVAKSALGAKVAALADAVSAREQELEALRKEVQVQGASLADATASLEGAATALEGDLPMDEARLAP